MKQSGDRINNNDIADYDFLPVNCRSAVDGLCKRIAFRTEVTDSYICFYEALWTAMHYEDIDGRRSRGSLRYNTNDHRKKMILSDFKEEDMMLKNAVVCGDYWTLKMILDKRKHYNHIHMELWSNMKEGWRMPDGKTQLIVSFDGHCVCANIMKVLNELEKKKEPDEYIEDIKDKSSGNDGVYTLCRRDKKKGEEEDEESFEDRENWFLDIETYYHPKTGVMTPYLIVVVTPTEEKIFWDINYCVEDFTKWLISKIDTQDGTKLKHSRNAEKIALWTFNGSRFDLIFLLKGLVDLPSFKLVGSMKTVKTLSVGNLTCFDLLRICPFGSLKKTAEFWKIGMNKFEMDHDKITREYLETELKNDEKQKIIEYCVQDCKVLGGCVAAYSKFVKEVLGIDPYVVSAAALSIRYFSKIYAPPMSKPIKGVPRHVYPIIKASYYGGICQVFRKRPNPGEKIYVFDRNSSYPAEMMNRETPVRYRGYNEISPLIDLGSVPKEWFNDCTLYGVSGLRWREDTIYPTIPKRTNSGLRYEKENEGVQWIWGVELAFAVSTGFVEGGYVFANLEFDTQPIFKTFIAELYRMRIECKNKGDEVGSAFYKLIMNSCYGKFGQQIYPQKSTMSDRRFIYAMEMDKILNNIASTAKIEEGIYEVTYKEMNYSKQIGGCVQIASWYTACAREALMRAAFEATNGFTEKTLFYSDTDSVFTSKPLPSHMCDPNVLGKWKLEYECDDAIFCAPKVYWLKKSDGTESMKFKGIPKDSLKKEHYEELINSNTTTINSGFVFTRSVGYVTKKSNIKTMIVIDKRNFPDLFTSNPL